MTFKFTSGLQQCLLYYYDFMIFLNSLFPFVQISTKSNQKMCDEAIDEKLLTYTADSLSSPCRPARALNDVYTFSFSLPAAPPAETIFLLILYTRKLSLSYPEFPNYKTSKKLKVEFKPCYILLANETRP